MVVVSLCSSNNICYMSSLVVECHVVILCWILIPLSFLLSPKIYLSFNLVIIPRVSMNGLNYFCFTGAWPSKHFLMLLLLYFLLYLSVSYLTSPYLLGRSDSRHICGAVHSSPSMMVYNLLDTPLLNS